MAAALAALFATVFVVLAITGTARMYTPVPFWDMWGATLGFYIAINDGASWLWWAQHNEHRIVLSRLLFWMDYEFFGGLSIFLLTMNYVFVALAVILFWRISRARLQHLAAPTRRSIVFFTSCFLIAWLFQWMQHENLAWAFQSQFFLAQLLPLCAFYLLHKSAINDKAYATFAAACLLGIASAGTMANGILTLPLMTVYALLTRMRLWQALTLISLTVVTLTLYFQEFSSPQQHGSITDALTQQPLQVAQYVLLYLGTPFYYLFGRSEIGNVAAVASTGLMALITFFFLFRGIKAPRENTLPLALVFSISYLAGTALGTAAGRIMFGVYQATSFRYTTPALMAWACLLMLLLPWLWQQGQRYPRRILTSIAVTVGLMLNLQLDAARAQHQLVFDRKLAGLALTLGIEDEAQILHVFEMSLSLMRTAEAAEASRLGMFAIYPWRGLKSSLGQSIVNDSLPQCAGHVDIVSTITPDQNYIVLQGWLFNSQQRQTPQLITLADTSGVISGYALTGQARPDVAEAVDANAYRSGFRGYVDRELAGETIILVGDTAPCQLTVELPTEMQNP